MIRKRLLACLALLLVLPLPAAAVDMKVTSSTQYLWYNDIVANDDDESKVAQYLRMSLTKLNEANTVSIYGYGRATKEFSDLKDNDDVAGRLYYFYLDYRDMLKDFLDLKAGRHFVYIPSASAIIDGATLDFKKIGPVGVRVLGGREVKFAGDRGEITGSEDYFMGTSLYTDAIRLTHLELSYARKYDNADVAREVVGFSASTYLLKKASLYGETKYDVLTESTSELLTGIKYSPLDRLTLTGEYYQSYPQFDATSIYSVFAVNKYQEALIRAEYALTDAYRFFVGYAKEDFNDGEDADLYEAGVAAKPTADLVINASYDKRNGFGGTLDGWRLNARYTMGKTVLAAGADWDDFRRDTFSENTAKKYWIGGTHAFADKYTLVSAQRTMST
jgi:hypothetical protein